MDGRDKPDHDSDGDSIKSGRTLVQHFLVDHVLPNRLAVERADDVARGLGVVAIQRALLIVMMAVVVTMLRLRPGGHDAKRQHRR